MAQIYLASPFFSEEQITRIEMVEKALTNNKTVADFYSPRKHQEAENEEFTKPWAKEIYQRDIENIEAADAVLAVIDFDGPNVDSGTAYEIGAAVAMGKPVVVFQQKDNTVNLMISESLHAYLKTGEEVENYDFKTMPTSEYNGDFI
ncbi:nucleoside 2-deoxyribosyltransferase [Fructilactobacillus frigidiflavus]|uniref:nucleoside 2-deoxyribosyltransferase n=1 Tax=Fructilactobacillus frigidiflavus TaxID=3242688 RepID=UPI0037571BEF